MTDRKRQETEEAKGTEAEKIGGVAHQHPDWGKQQPAGRDRTGGKPEADATDREDRRGTPKRSA